MGVPECASGVFRTQSGRIAGAVRGAGQINVLRWHYPPTTPRLQLLHPAAGLLQVLLLPEAAGVSDSVWKCCVLTLLPAGRSRGTRRQRSSGISLKPGVPATGFGSGWSRLTGEPGSHLLRVHSRGVEHLFSSLFRSPPLLTHCIISGASLYLQNRCGPARRYIAN